jgi:hypothetical protein
MHIGDAMPGRLLSTGGVIRPLPTPVFQGFSENSAPDAGEAVVSTEISRARAPDRLFIANDHDSTLIVSSQTSRQVAKPVAIQEKTGTFEQL